MENIRSVISRCQMIPLLLLAFLLPVLSTLSGRHVYILLLLVAIGLLVSGWRHLFSPAPFWRAPLLILLVLSGVWGAASLSWSVNPEAAKSILMRAGMLTITGALALTIISRLSLSEMQFANISRAFLAGMAVAVASIVSIILCEGGIVAFLSEHLSKSGGYSPNSIKQGNLLMAILVWPSHIILLVQGRRKLAFAILPVALLLLWFMPSRTAIASLLASLCFYGVILSFNRVWQLALSCVALCVTWWGVLLALPRLALPGMWDAHNMAPSFVHRLHIWQFTIEKIAERPLLGWGLKSSDNLPEVTKLTQNLHPHHNFLQAWLDFGLPGVLMYIGLAMLALLGIFRLHIENRVVNAAAYAAVICALVGGMAGFGLWQSWWLSGNILIAMLMALIMRYLAERKIA